MQDYHSRNLYDDEEPEKDCKNYYSQFFNQQSPVKKQTRNFNPSLCSEEDENASVGDEGLNSDDHKAEENYYEDDEIECEGESDLKSIFNMSNNNKEDSWIEESIPAEKDAVLDSRPDSSLSFKFKDNILIEGEGDALSNANLKRRDVCIKSILRSMRRYY
jgi:hypothetical protein